MSGYAFHPEAFTDLDQIWEYIAERNLDGAGRVMNRPPDHTHRAPGR